MLCEKRSLLFILLLPFITVSLEAQKPLPDSPDVEQMADAMLAKLTLGEKIDLIGGEDGLFVRAQPKAGFPKLKMSDGPLGVGSWGPSTAYASGIALAATWDPYLAKEVGDSIGLDARARGVHILLGPGVNLFRAPMNGRNFEYFGEDPFLASRIAVGYIEGVQGEGVIATVKHFAANNEEYDRHSVSSDIDERTLREMYLPAFEAAVREAHVGAVMDSYNLVNGTHSTQNGHLNLDILKRDWGFNGILMSDWDATYDGIAAANSGLDLEMPSGKNMNRKTLLSAVQQGQVSEAVIDDKVRRIFRTALRFGFLDRPQRVVITPLFREAASAVALEEACEGIVLLKNDNSLLPLNSRKVQKLAVIGPGAWPLQTGGGGSSQVTPFSSMSLAEALAKRSGADVPYARGLPTVNEFFDDSDFGDAGTDPEDASTDLQPVKVETFGNPDFKGSPESTEYTDHIDSWRSEEWTPSATVRKSIRYSVTFTPPKSGRYLLLTAAGATDTYKVMVDGRLVLEQSQHEGQAPQSVEVSLIQGKAVVIQLDYCPDATYARVGLGIRAVDDLIAEEAKEVATTADVVIVSVGFDWTNESEGFDRTFGLPWGQDELIEAVRKVNPRTIVIVTAGGDIDTSRWLSTIPAFVQNWYPGQEGGTAMAEILFGDHAPEGKLPISYERSWEDNPVHDNYYATPAPPGQIRHVKYAEDVFLGYRYYTSANKKPLYPFGFGLSYTTFSFSRLRISPPSLTAGKSLAVSFEVANTGKRPGTEVAEVYVGDPSASIVRPVKELKGFEKVRLAPGQRQRVTISLNARAFSYWSESDHSWRIDPGRFVVYVGDSSENTPLMAEAVITD